MAKLDKYKIDNMTETESNTVTTTSYPVEKGFAITDSIQLQPQTFSISGRIVRKTQKEADAVKTSIKNLQKKGKLVKYIGRINASDVLITSFSPSYDGSIANGFNMSLELQQIRIAKTPYVKKKTKKKVSGKKSVKKKNSGPVYHKVKKGDTYWGCWKKYGTPIATLRKWNKYPDRRIPIGVKLRVK